MTADAIVQNPTADATPPDVDDVRTLVDRFRLRQENDGNVAAPATEDAALIREIADRASAVMRRHGQFDLAEAFSQDVADWAASGLDGKPDFGRTRDASVAPADGQVCFFAAPILTTNGPLPVGRRLECFLVVRREPEAFDELNTMYPHPKNNCQSVLLLCASTGFRTGNCLVFFPENVAAATAVREQKYALFFFSKFRKIHDSLAVPAARAILEPSSVPSASAGLGRLRCYEARSTWGCLHDYFHHQGRWPFDENITLKSNWFVGLLEETKVDALTATTGYCDDRLPDRDEQFDMILLERLFRYPRGRAATRNFDSGTGVFLFSWLRERDAFTPSDGGLFFDRPRAMAALDEYVAEMNELEQVVTSDEEYREAALRLVRRHFAPGEGRDRFSFTDDQRMLLRGEVAAEGRTLEFADGET